MKHWFAGCSTVAAIKNRYRDLAKRHHPDLGGDNETMKAINAAYKLALKAADGEISQGADGREHTYHYNEKVEQAVMDMIVELLKLRMADVRILLIGTWVWVIGDTKPHKETLKGLGLWWNGKRQAWTFHVGRWRGRSHPGGLASIARTYGVHEFEQQAAGMVAT